MRALVLTPVLVVLLCAPVAHTAHARTDAVAASDFAERTVRLLTDNRYATAWRTLHPAHQRATGGRSRYAACEARSPITGVTTVEAVSARSRRAWIAGVGHVPVKAVTLRVGLLAREPVLHTVHVVLVRGQWRWVLPAARYASYSQGLCD